jgi:hypothetical protein
MIHGINALCPSVSVLLPSLLIGSGGANGGP